MPNKQHLRDPDSKRGAGAESPAPLDQADHDGTQGSRPDTGIPRGGPNEETS